MQQPRCGAPICRMLPFAEQRRASSRGRRRRLDAFQIDTTSSHHAAPFPYRLLYKGSGFESEKQPDGPNRLLGALRQP